MQTKAEEESPATTSPNPTNPVSRRGFLKGAITLLGGSLMAACGTRQDDIARGPGGWITPTPARALPSPAPPSQGTPTPEVENLDGFLALSSLLTGVENLDPDLGRIYLQSLREDPDFSGGVQGFFEQAGLLSGMPERVETLAERGLFDDEGTRSIADRIIEMWYTGIAKLDGEDTVVTFVDALAYKVLHFTKPLTICGSYGFWAEKPKVEV